MLYFWCSVGCRPARRPEVGGRGRSGGRGRGQGGKKSGRLADGGWAGGPLQA